MIFTTKKPIIFFYFQDLGTLYMFIGYFFKENPNSKVSRVTKAISRVQGNNENGNSRDQDRE